MSYMRGEYYVWTGDDGVHIWGGEEEQINEYKGVCIPEEVMDALALMMVAEFADEPERLGPAINLALQYRGNCGCVALCELLGERSMMDMLADLQTKIKKRQGGAR